MRASRPILVTLAAAAFLLTPIAAEAQSSISRHVTCEDYPVAATKAKLDRAVEIAGSGDVEAFRRLVENDPLVSLTGKGKVVYLTDTHDWGSIAEIRPRGKTAAVFTVVEAIQKRVSDCPDL